MDIFRRSESEAFEELQRFSDALSKSFNKINPRQVAEPSAPGPYAARFRRASGKNTPDTDIERKLVAAVGSPVALGYLSNALLYSPRLRHLRGTSESALYRLVKGGAIQIIQTSNPSDFWLVPGDQNIS